MDGFLAFFARVIRRKKKEQLNFRIREKRLPPKSPTATTTTPGRGVPPKIRSGCRSRTTIVSTSADRWRKKLNPSLEVENSCCNRADSASYNSFSSPLCGDCVSMQSFLVVHPRHFPTRLPAEGTPDKIKRSGVGSTWRPPSY